MFAGIAIEGPKLLDRNDLYGTEDPGREDTGDGDYGRLLDRVYGKGVASPTRLAQIGGRLRRAA